MPQGSSQTVAEVRDAPECFFLRSSIGYLGHVVDEQGIHPTEEKVRAIEEAPAPTNVTQLHSFLGLINYYHKFLPSLAATLTPLYKLLNKCQRWAWTDQQQAAFQLAKDALQSNSSLLTTTPVSPCIWLVMPRITALGPCCHTQSMAKKIDCIHFSNTFITQNPLLTAGKGGPRHCFRSEETSLLPPRSSFQN